MHASATKVFVAWLLSARVLFFFTKDCFVKKKKKRAESSISLHETWTNNMNPQLWHITFFYQPKTDQSMQYKPRNQVSSFRLFVYESARFKPLKSVVCNYATLLISVWAWPTWIKRLIILSPVIWHMIPHIETWTMFAFRDFQKGIFVMQDIQFAASSWYFGACIVASPRAESLLLIAFHFTVFFVWGKQTNECGL